MMVEKVLFPRTPQLAGEDAEAKRAGIQHVQFATTRADGL